jgi:hypothetical protein
MRAQEVIETADNGFLCLLNVDILVRFGATGEFLWQRRYSLPQQYTIYMEPGLSRDGDGHYRIICDAYSGADGIPYLGMLTTQQDSVADVRQRSSLMPEDLTLNVFPNPFNTATQLEFTLPSTQRVSLRLYDVLGREVAVMVNEIRTAGRHRLTFDASGLPSGVYLCRLEAGGMAQTRKIVLLK